MQPILQIPETGPPVGIDPRVRRLNPTFRILPGGWAAVSLRLISNGIQLLIPRFIIVFPVESAPP